MKIKYEAPLCECKGCYYWRKISMYASNSPLKCCHYAIDEGRLRGIPPIDCYKHKDTPYRKKG